MVLAKTRPNTLVKIDALLEAFADFLSIDVGSGDAAPDTIYTYRCQVKQYLQWCAENQLHPAAATLNDIKHYRRWLIEEKKLKPATISLKLSVVRRFYDAAIDKGLIKLNPAAVVKPPSEKSNFAEKITYLEKSEVEALLAAIPNDGSLKTARDQALLAIMVLEGIRSVEIHRANLGDLIQQEHNLGIRVEGKRNIRTIPLTPDLAKVLINYLTARTATGEILEPKSPLFIAVSHRSCGQRLSRRSIREIVDNYLKLTGLKHCAGRIITAHSLRHTAGTLAVRGGADLRQVQDLLGHKDLRTTAIYTHVAERWSHNPALKIGIKLDFLLKD